LQFDWLAPYQVTLLEAEARGSNDAVAWGSYGPFTYVQLSASAHVVSINKQLYNYIHSKDATQNTHAFLFPMKDWHLYDEFINGKQTGGGAIQQVRMLSLLAWILLLIACINFMNLATARSEKRAKEVGVRKVLGAGRKGLVAQFIGEALSMSALAGGLSLILISLGLPVFNTLVQKQLLLHMDNPTHAFALFVVIIICGFIAGSYPSFYLSSFKPSGVLKGLKLKTGNAAFIRKALAVFQFAVSVIFIVSTIVIYLQIQHVKNRKLGFNKNNLIEINMQQSVTGSFALIKHDLLKTGFVENASLADHTILYGGNDDDRFTWEGKSPDQDVSIAFRHVGPEFVATTGMRITEGADFDASKRFDSSNVMVNESLAKLLGNGESAVGKIIHSPRGESEGHYRNLTVIGVVNDYIYGNIFGTPEPVLFFCDPYPNSNLVYVRIKQQADPEQALTTIQAAVKKDNPAYPFEYRFVDDQFNEMFQTEVQASKVSTAFAVLAIIISCLGLFGLATYSAERRIKEIGIRKVLGSSVGGIAALLSKDFLKLVLISCLVAFPVAWWKMHDWLQSYQYRIQISWWIFLLSGLVAMLIALVTISFQSIKAAAANPVKSLRTE
jgi:ABC-type antimicrobial peptide transport system permease subunit